MLRLEAGIAEDFWVSGHVYKGIGGHGFPEFVEKNAIVDLCMFKT